MDEKQEFIMKHILPDREPTLNVKVTRNTRGYTWEITVLGAPDANTAIAMIDDTAEKIRNHYIDDQ